MHSCTFELIVNILTYAIKNKEDTFSQKDFKNVVYTEEFDNLDLNEKISDGCSYLVRRGLLQLENKKATYYEKYKLPETIKINTDNFTKVYKNLSNRIILMHEGKDMINETYEVKDDFSEIIEAVDFINSSYLDLSDNEELKITLSKILISFVNESESRYSLLTLLQLLKLKSSMKIKIKNKDTEFYANNVTFKYIQFNDDVIMLHFNKCSFEINTLASIREIEFLDKLPLSANIDKSINILKKYSNEKASKIIDFLKSI